MDTTALVLSIIGAINWALYGLFGGDVIGGLFGGAEAVGARIAYSIIGLAGIWCISMLFREGENAPIADKQR
jgi:uncharacterized membrane protein YuzA (DUF378 family)